MRITQKFATSTIVYSSPTYNATINATGTRIDTEKHVGDGARTYATIDGTGLGARYLYNHPDHLTGANVITTGARTFEGVLDYMPFGGVRVDSKAGSWSEQRQYAGHDFDQTSGYSYMKARYYDPQVKRFLGEDKVFWSVGYDLTDPQLANSYSYARNTPITHLDPDGNEPTKAQAGTIESFVKILNNSPRQVGRFRGEAASTYMMSLGDFQLLPKPDATQAQYFNTRDTRYIYTENGGWIDMSHFMFYAGQAYKLKQDGISNPVGEAVQRGYLQERFDSIFSRHSAYSYEDLPSDRFGAEFGANYFNPDSKTSLGEQLKNYFKDILNSSHPLKAPNYESLPSKDSRQLPTRTNRTTNPIDLK